MVALDECVSPRTTRNPILHGLSGRRPETFGVVVYKSSAVVDVSSSINGSEATGQADQPAVEPPQHQLQTGDSLAG